MLISTAEMKSSQPSTTIDLKSFDAPVSVNLRPPPIERHKSFDEEEVPEPPVVPKKANIVPINVKSYSIADLQMATGSFDIENLLGEGSFGRVYRAQFDDGKVSYSAQIYCSQHWVVSIWSGVGKVIS